VKNYVYLTVMILLVITSACDDSPVVTPHRKQIVLIFSDVTSSLLPSENEKVANLTADVVDSLAPGTFYQIYPIQIEARVTPVKEGHVLTNTTDQGNTFVKEKRRNELIQFLGGLYNVVKGVRDNNAKAGKPDNHTCILNTLRVADQQLRQYDHAKYDLDLVYISDMIEECNRPDPMHQPLTLAKRDISNEIDLASRADLKLDFSGVRIAVIIPATNETYTVMERPSLEQLKRFWEAIFRHCGYSDALLADPNQFYFSAGLPQRFKPYVKVSQVVRSRSVLEHTISKTNEVSRALAG
jgi:hypothetical protein